jgi:cyclohexyl-isocyanide hydratase
MSPPMTPASLSMTGDEPRLQVAALIFPGMTLLDFAGPQAAFGLHARTHLVWKSVAPVETDSGVSILPTTRFDDCPMDLDVLFVPGGFGTAAVLDDPETLAFLKSRGERARYVTSVCSGSLILAAAGLLEGYRATTHWTSHDILEAFGVEAERSRVVVDRNRFTGGGVTAGIDFGLTLLAALRGEMIAKVTQLAMEYDPKPPFDCGSPAGAGPELAAMVRGMVDQLSDRNRIMAVLAGRAANSAA